MYIKRVYVKTDKEVRQVWLTVTTTPRDRTVVTIRVVLMSQMEIDSISQVTVARAETFFKKGETLL